MSDCCGKVSTFFQQFRAGFQQTFNNVSTIRCPKSGQCSRYAYSYNNPLKYTDPSGHTPEPYTDEWWVARYYALELWKNEDPGHDISTPEELQAKVCSSVEECTERLGIYGITRVDTSQISDPNHQLGILRNLLSAIRAMAARVGAGSGTPLEEAFKLVFGSTNEVFIANGSSIGEGFTQNNNCDANLPGCNDGNGHIYLADGQLSRELIYHEFGHNLTNGWGGNRDFEDVFENNDGSLAKSYAELNFTHILGDYSTSGWRDEITADAFANWMVNGDTGNSKKAEEFMIYVLCAELATCS